MNPLYFGPSSQPLYGIYHPRALPSIDRNEGIVICNTFGQEYMRAHRACRQLAKLLVKIGYPVLRFDYRGTGDSAGDLEDVNPEEWIEDISVAVDELREISGVEKVSLVGMRLGALLASSFCQENMEIEQVVLWDPVVSGEAYVQELLEEIAGQDDSTSNFVDENNVLHFNGFPVTPVFRESLEKLDTEARFPNVTSVVMVVSGEDERTNRIKGAWKDNEKFHYYHTPIPGNWNYVDSFGGILLPQPVIQAIVQWFEKT